MPKRDLDRPPPNACPLREALHRYRAPEPAAAAEAAPSAEEERRVVHSPDPDRLPAGRPWLQCRPDWLRRGRSAAVVDAADAEPMRLQETERQLRADGWARLAAGEWTAWGREGTPTGPWRRIPAEAWPMLRPRRGGVVQVTGSGACYYSVLVAPPPRRRPSIAAVRAALVAAEAKPGGPLTLREVDDVASKIGAVRALARAVFAELRRQDG